MNRSNNNQNRISITMHAAPLSIAKLYTEIEQASNKEMASVISKAFEQIEANQKENSVHIKQETIKEIRIEDLATKTDLKELELKMVEQKLELHKEISTSKWQVLGGMAILLFVQLTGKHFGLF